MSPDRRGGRWAQWRRVRARRLLAALLVGAAVVAGLSALRPAPEPTRDVVIAARDVPAGQRLVAADLTVESWPQDLVPQDRPSRDRLVGQYVLGRVDVGEPVTSSRLLADRNLPAPSGTDLVVSIPVTDPGVTGLLQVGDRVDVLDPQGGTAARAAHVVAVVAGDGDGWKSTSAPSVLLAVTRAAATRIAQASALGTGSPAPLTVALAPDARDER